MSSFTVIFNKDHQVREEYQADIYHLEPDQTLSRHYPQFAGDDLYIGKLCPGEEEKVQPGDTAHFIGDESIYEILLLTMDTIAPRGMQPAPGMLFIARRLAKSRP